jgi:hypothetical protein
MLDVLDPNSPVWLILPLAAIYLGMRLRVPRRE